MGKPTSSLKGIEMNKQILAMALLLTLSTGAQASDEPRLVDAGIVAATAAMITVGSPLIALVGTAGLMSESMMFFQWLRQPSPQE